MIAAIYLDRKEVNLYCKNYSCFEIGSLGTTWIKLEALFTNIQYILQCYMIYLMTFSLD